MAWYPDGPYNRIFFTSDSEFPLNSIEITLYQALILIWPQIPTKQIISLAQASISQNLLQNSNQVHFPLRP